MRILLVQLSDIHLTERNEEIKKRLEGVAKACISLLNQNTIIVFILSGDIAYSGTKEQYEVFLDYFNNAKKIIEEERDISIYTVCVPGNHDCFFTEEDKLENGSGSIRNLIIKNLVPQNNVKISKEYLESILTSQNNYNNFKRNFSLNSINALVDFFTVSTSIGHIVFVLLNSAWVSKYHEKPGEIFFLNDMLNLLDEKIEEIATNDKTFIVTVYHHPSHWFHPDNKYEFDKKVRSFSDLILVGHEHRDDFIEMSGNDWNTIEFIADAFNVNNSNESGFSVFCFNNDFEHLKKIEYKWEKDIYKRYNDESINLELSQCISVTYPNANTNEWLNDLELPLPHYKLMKPLTLPMIYCWPELEHLYYGTEEEKNIHETEKIKENIFDALTQKGLNIIVGDTYSGKTSLAKRIYKVAGKNNKNCVYIKGELFSSFKEEKINQIIEEKYIEQYNEETLEYFRQLSTRQKFLILDNFLDIKINSKKIGTFLNYLCTKFSAVIIFINSTLEISMIMSQFSDINKDNTVRTYRILPMGNVKRNEMITKWYSLAEDYAQPADDISSKIDRATTCINHILSSQRASTPAYPLYMLFWLQSIDSGNVDTNNTNNYIFFYSTIIRQCLMKALLNTQNSSMQSNINIYENILSHIAYEMLINIETPLSYSDCSDVIENFAKKMQIALKTDSVINLMQRANIFLIDNNNNVRFKYPYMYYYFVGNYIERNYKKAEIKDLVQHMSQNLHNESYGNIMIFVCSFSINDSIIDDILLNALSMFDDVPMYDFTETPKIMAIAEKRIQELYNNSIVVGDENDVAPAQEKKREMSDKAKICDGQVYDTTLNNQNDESDAKYFKDFYAAQKIIIVLGQIIHNYPGEINGERKEEIITEIHHLGMRLVNMYHTILSQSLDETLKFIEDRIKSSVKKPNIERQKLKENMTTLFALILLDFTNCVLSLEASSFGDSNSLITAENVLSNTISGQLVLYHLKADVLKSLPIDKIINDYKKLEEDNFEFACMELKALVTVYLKYNQCGTFERDKLCSNFNLLKNKILIDKQKNIEK